MFTYVPLPPDATPPGVLRANRKKDGTCAPLDDILLLRLSSVSVVVVGVLQLLLSSNAPIAFD